MGHGKQETSLLTPEGRRGTEPRSGHRRGLLAERSPRVRPELPSRQQPNQTMGTATPKELMLLDAGGRRPLKPGNSQRRNLSPE